LREICRWIGRSKRASGHGALYGIAPIAGGTGEYQRDDSGAVAVLHKGINAKLLAHKNVLNEISSNKQSSNRCNLGLAGIKTILTKLPFWIW
jgi:hypothetical protein